MLHKIIETTVWQYGLPYRIFIINIHWAPSESYKIIYMQAKFAGGPTGEGSYVIP